MLLGSQQHATTAPWLRDWVSILVIHSFFSEGMVAVPETYLPKMHSNYVVDCHSSFRFELYNYKYLNIFHLFYTLESVILYAAQWDGHGWKTQTLHSTKCRRRAGHLCHSYKRNSERLPVSWVLVFPEQYLHGPQLHQNNCSFFLIFCSEAGRDKWNNNILLLIGSITAYRCGNRLQKSFNGSKIMYDSELGVGIT